MVRSAYRMIIKTESSLEETESKSNIAAEGQSGLYLWGTSVPSKLKVFLCRLAQHSIPTGDVLHHQNMAMILVCSLGGAADS